MADTPRTGISIFSRILIALVLVNATTGLVLFVTGYDFVGNLIERRAKESIQQQISVVREHFEGQYREDVDQWLRWLSDSSHIDDFLYAPRSERRVIHKRIERLLKSAVQDFEGIDGASFVGATGFIDAVAPARRRGEKGLRLTAESVAGRPSAHAARLHATARLFKRVQETPLLISSGNMEWFMPPREVFVEGPFVGDQGQVSAVAALGKLDVDTGTFGGAVIVNVNLTPFLRELRNLRFFGESLIWVLDPEGRVLLRPNDESGSFDPRAMLPTQLKDQGGLVQAEQGIVAYRDFAMAAGKPMLRVAVAVPQSLLVRDLAPAVRHFSVVLGLSVIVAFFVSLYVSRYLSRPIIELAQAVARLARGDLSTQVRVKTTGEVQTLVHSFNRMTDDLRDSVAARDASMSSLRREIAERQRVEQELRQQAHDLEEARSAAESAGRAKGEFLATMSHEIRTPINGVLGMTELLLASDLNPRQRRLAQTTRRSGETLLGVINDILDFSKIEAGKLELHPEPFQLRELMEGVGEIFAGTAHGKGIELVVCMASALDGSYDGDSGRLRQVLINLVGNALKFTDDGEVVLEVRQQARDGKRCTLRFEIRDTGIGVAHEAQTSIFDAFSQADSSSTRQHGGSGLGLGICRRLVALMGGEIGLESEPGQGSCFFFTVVVDRERPEVPGDTPLFDHGSRVLVVDDNAASSAVMRDAIAAWGLQPRCAGSAGEALDALREARSEEAGFDMVLVDVHMPGVNGLDLARAISADPTLSGVALVLLGAMGDNLDEVLHTPGTRAQITKPVRHDELRHALDSVLSGVRTVPAVVAGNGLDLTPTFDARVLVVEDNPVNQEVAVRMLELLGCDVEIAGDGQVATEAFRPGRFDLVLMDCQMPRMDGYEATSRMRAMEREQNAPRVPIVAVTANAFNEVRERCMVAGMDEHLTKPFTASDLVARMTRVLDDGCLRAVPVSGEDDTSSSQEAIAPLAPPPGCARLDARALSSLRALSRDDADDALARFADMYRSGASELMEQLAAAVDEHDAVAINDTAHTLKSSSASIGATDLSALCKEMEALGRRRDLEPVAGLLVQVQREYAAVCRALDGLGAESRAA